MFGAAASRDRGSRKRLLCNACSDASNAPVRCPLIVRFCGESSALIPFSEEPLSHAYRSICAITNWCSQTHQSGLDCASRHYYRHRRAGVMPRKSSGHGNGLQNLLHRLLLVYIYLMHLLCPELNLIHSTSRSHLEHYLVPTAREASFRHYRTPNSPNQQRSTSSSAMASTTSFLDAIKARRTYYALNKTAPISDERIEEILRDLVLHVPSSFNSQSARLVVLLKREHETFWDIVKDTLKAHVSAEQWTRTETKLNGFSAAYGTVSMNSAIA